MMVLIYKSRDYIHHKNHPLFFWFSFSSNLFSILSVKLMLFWELHLQIYKIITLEIEGMEEETFPELFRNLYL